MQTYDILQAHFQRAHSATYRWLAVEDMTRAADVLHADRQAADCAALHVAIDCMQRIAARHTVAPDTRHYPPIARRPQHEATNGAVAILARHSQRVHDARTFGGDAKASLQATTVALVSVLR